MSVLLHDLLYFKDNALPLAVKTKCHVVSKIKDIKDTHSTSILRVQPGIIVCQFFVNDTYCYGNYIVQYVFYW
jgi:hypothetical protein